MKLETLHYLWNYPLNTNWVLGISVPITLILLWVAHRQTTGRKLELKPLINVFSNAGLMLNQKISTEDLINQLPGKGNRYDHNLLLIIYGYGVFVEENWQRFSQQALTFDYECVDEPDSYLEIFSDFIQLIPKTEEIIAYSRMKGNRLCYRIGEIERTLTPKFDNDWADDAIINQLVMDIRKSLPKPYQIWKLEDGQSVTFVVLTIEGEKYLRENTQIRLTVLEEK